MAQIVMHLYRNFQSSANPTKPLLTGVYAWGLILISCTSNNGEHIPTYFQIWEIDAYIKIEADKLVATQLVIDII